MEAIRLAEALEDETERVRERPAAGVKGVLLGVEGRSFRMLQVITRAAGGVDDAFDGASPDYADLACLRVIHSEPMWCLTLPVRIERKDEHTLVEHEFFCSDMEPLWNQPKTTTSVVTQTTATLLLALSCNRETCQTINCFKESVSCLCRNAQRGQG